MPLRGESVGTAYVRILADGTGLPRSIRKVFNDADGDLHDAGGSGSRAYVEGFEDDMKAHGGQSMSEALGRALAHDDFTQRFFQSSNWKNFEHNMKAQFGKVGEEASDELRLRFLKKGNLQGIEKEVEKMVSTINSKLGDGRSNHALVRLSQTIDHLGLGLGRAFGKGSRNNFLNFFGSFVTNSIKVLGLLPRMVGNLQEFGDGFKAAAETGKGFFDTIKGGFATMAKDAEGAETALAGLFETGPAGFIALGVALLTIIPLLSVIAALVSGITAAIIALASSISFALVGALIPLLPLLAATALAIGGLIGLFKSLSDQDKKALKPLVDRVKELGQAVKKGFLEGLDLGTGDGAFGRLEESLKRLKTLAFSVGQGLGAFTSHFVHFLNSSGFDALQARLSVFIPQALGKMGRIARNIFATLGNLTLDAVPFANDFLDWLVKITREFRHFVHDNPDKIGDFFSDAVDSAKTLFNFVGKIGAVLGDLLFSKSGKRSGDTIIDDMSKKLHDLDKFLDDHPGALADFFEEGKQTARDIGNLALSIGNLFDKLDSPEGHKALHAIFQFAIFLGKLSAAVADAGQLAWAPIQNGIDLLHALGTALGKAKKKIGDFFANLSGKGGGRGFTALSINPAGLVKWIPGAVAKIQGFVDSVGGKMSALRTRISGIWSDIKTRVSTAASSAATNVAHAINSIPGRISGIANDIVSSFSGIPGRIINIFSGLGDRIAAVIGDIHINITWPDPPSWFSKLSPGGFLLDKLRSASGGIWDRASMRIIGEAGPEAVVPLNRPLSQVDPSVRWLSAIAQGLTPPPSTAGQGQAGRVIHNEWNLTMPGIDPRAAAAELLNRMTASAY